MLAYLENRQRERPTLQTASLLAERCAQYALDCRELLKASGVPARYAQIDLENLREGLPAGYYRLAGILLGIVEQPTLVAISGPWGVGKTALACGLVTLFCNCRKCALYHDTREVFDKLKAAFTNGNAEEVSRAFESVDLLVLDELQLRDVDRDWQERQLTTLIDRRYRQLRSTLLLCNLKGNELLDNLGPWVQRRLMEEGGIEIAEWGAIDDVLNRSK